MALKNIEKIRVDGAGRGQLPPSDDIGDITNENQLYNSRAITIGDFIYVIGGTIDTMTYSASIYELNVLNNVVTEYSNYIPARSGTGITPFGDSILAFGIYLCICVSIAVLKT